MALRGVDGQEVWRSPVSKATGRAILHKDKVLLSSKQGELLALKLQNGEVSWRYPVQGTLLKGPVVAKDRILFVDGSNTLYALNTAGEWRWQYRREAPKEFALFGEAQARIEGDRVVLGFSDGTAVGLSLSDGAVLWTRSLSRDRKFPDIDATAAYLRGKFYLASVEGGLFALDPDSGEILKAFPITGITQMLEQDGQSLILCLEHSIIRIDLEGRLIWSHELGDLGSPGEPVVVDRYLSFSSSRGGLHILDVDTGQSLALFRPRDSLFAPPTMARDGSIFFSTGSYLYALRPERRCITAEELKNLELGDAAIQRLLCTDRGAWPPGTF